ncbi:MAG: NPCBM/NEW2 domain-containing protein [Candidatus Kryptoniota bacterium]
MRGIPRIAVERNLPVAGSDQSAKDIYSNNNLCAWLHDMYTVDASKTGAQDYYNSLFNLYASWGVDFVKVDDLSSPYHADETEMIRKAIDNCGRHIVLSTSPGETPVKYASHIQQHANMWRIVGDFWDNWPQLKEHFEVCNRWAPYISFGAWPDADMLPLGHIGIRAERGNDRMSQLTNDEQYTLMTLFAIFRSPLMFGGDLPTSDSFTISLLTNRNVLSVNKSSINNRQLLKNNDIVVWSADDPSNGDKYLAFFNIADQQMIVKEKAIWTSGVISRDTPGQSIDIDIDITGTDKLYLAVTDGGDNIDWDHADWITPVIYNNHDTIKLTSLNWIKAMAGWGEVQINKSVSGGKLILNNKEFTEGIGTHSNSIIEYDIPAGYNHFKASAGLDHACMIQQAGATVEFMVFKQNPAGPLPPDSEKITLKLNQLDMEGEFLVENLWTGEKQGVCKDEITVGVRRHASVLYKLRKQ